MLIGEFRHTIDAKNRLSIPSKFRQEMGNQVILTTGLDSCLFIYTMSNWEKVTSRLAESESSMLQADNRGFNRYFLGGAVEAEIDNAGRILVPSYLRERGGLVGNKVVIVGVRDRAEVWDEGRWEEYRKNIQGRADALAEKIGQTSFL
ncbi:MAG: division/cell wall cluster transcriptional repressor MraZ [Patescibacteria group bacterium]|nr:division/cell wall cluster transcriptional repressor MraZ [Patescibacteria group bacterium]